MKFEFLNKALLIELEKKNAGSEKNEKIVILGDLHIGYEEALGERGIFLPRMQFKETLDDLKKIFEKLRGGKAGGGRGNGKVDKIIILGDLKHEFGTISAQEWKETDEILDFFKKNLKKSGEIVLIKGNHDTILDPIAKRKEIKIVNYFSIEDFAEDEKICFLHGHKLFNECADKKIKVLIIGHRHPAVLLRDKYKKERYKCFLVGKWKNKKVIILPSFFPFIEGSDVLNEGKENLLFISEKSLRGFEVYVISPNGAALKFGKLSRLKSGMKSV